MRLVDNLICDGDTATHVSMLVSNESPFIDENGFLEEVAFLEIIAQSLAAHVAFDNAKIGKKLQRGFLIGSKSLKINGQAKVGDELIIKIVKQISFGDFGVVDGFVYKEDELLASGEIKVWSDG